MGDKVSQIANLHANERRHREGARGSRQDVEPARAKAAKAQIDVLEEQLRQSQLQTEQATVDAEGRVSGRFFLRCRMTRTKRITYDIDFAARLWSISESIVRESRHCVIAIRLRKALSMEDRNDIHYEDALDRELNALVREMEQKEIIRRAVIEMLVMMGSDVMLEDDV